ncbi:MAG: replication initiator [Egibacteraceae bacterium]
MTATVIDLGQALVDILERGDEAQAIQDQARAVGGCEHPIRLHGQVDTVDRVTGELEPHWSTDTLPDGVVHTRCNGRASRCEPCSRLYQQDAWQLVVAGLAGGKGVPDSVHESPMLPGGCCRVALAGTRPARCASTASPRRAPAGTARTIPVWDGRCVWSVGTTRGRCCETRTSPSCGGVPASGFTGSWPPWSGSPSGS